jgi:hypothetical protein
MSFLRASRRPITPAKYNLAVGDSAAVVAIL